MIEDKELASLFQAESEEHLQSLDAGLLHLEANPRDKATLEQVFRNAHSLKGAARMLGVSPVEVLSHHFEDALGAAARGQTVLTPEVIDRLYRGLDAIRKLVDEAISGAPAGIDVQQALAQLSGQAPPAPPAASAAPAEPALIVAQSVNGDSYVPVPPEPAAPEPAAPEPVGPDLTASEPVASEPVAHVEMQKSSSAADGAVLAGSPAGFKIETIRVEPPKLDALMTLAGELTVTTTRVTRGLAEFEALTALWEEWHKDAVSSQRLFERAANGLLSATSAEGSGPGSVGLSSGGPSGVGTKLARFYVREQERLEQLGELLQRLRQTTYEDVTRLNFVADEMEESVRRIRLLPLATIFNLFPRMVRDLARAQSKEVQLFIEGGETAADKRILEELKDPLMHMMRNAIDHGIEAPAERERHGKPRVATLRLRGYQTSTNVVVELTDDGRGINVESVKRVALKSRLCSEAELASMSVEQIQMLIFAPGFSTSPLVTDVSGRGVGLDVVRANVEALRGSIQLQSSAGAGCRFQVQLPMTLATTRVLLVQVDSRTYAVPVEYVQRVYLMARREIFTIEGRDTIRLDDQPLSVVRLSQLLELRAAPPAEPVTQRDQPARIDAWPCIVLSLGEDQLGLIVDAVVDEQEVMLKPLGAMLKRVRNVSGATILGTGEVCMVLNPHDLMRSVHKSPAVLAAPAAETVVERRKSILLAEDSITTRTQEKRILEGAGYEVVTAVDGLDAFNKLNSRAFDAVVSDIQMPNMDGLALAARIRQNTKYGELPIILVTSLASDEDKRRGIEVGANAYITKGTFEQKVLVDTLRRLV